MAKPKVFVTRIILEPGLSLVTQICDAEIWSEELPPSREVLLERARGADGLLCLLTDRIDGEIMDAIGPQWTRSIMLPPASCRDSKHPSKIRGLCIFA